MTPPAQPDDTPSGPSGQYQPRHGDTGEFDRSALAKLLAEEAGGSSKGANGDSRGGRNGGRNGGLSSGPAGNSNGERAGFLAEVKDAVTLRSFLLTVAVLGLGLGFILSYVGGLHHPTAKNLPFGVVAPAQAQTQVLAGLSDLPGQPLSLRLLPDEGTARAQVRNRDLTGVLVVSATSTQDTLYVASAAGPSVSAAVVRILQSVEGAQHRTIAVTDLVPLSVEDGDGLTSFYLAVGWTVTGYLIASMLGVSAGTRPATAARALIRLIALALAAFAAGLGGAWLAQHVLGALPGPFWPLALIGTLIVFGAGALTMAMEIVFGIIGIGLAVLLFVILGNPSAGGAYARSLIPPFWRSIGAFLPPGAGTDAARSVAYFGGTDTATPLWILACYCLVGIVATLIAAAVLRPRERAAQAA